MHRYRVNQDVITRNLQCFLLLSKDINNKQKTTLNDIEVFNYLFGITPLVCAVTWFLICNYVEEDMGLLPVHLLWTFLFLKNYTKEELICTMIGNPDKKTIRKKIWAMIEKLSKLGSIVIVFDRRFEGDGPTPYRARVPIDGTDFRICQPSCKTEKNKNLSKEEKKNFRKSWYSHKFNGPGLRYEVGVCIVTGTICWIKGPFKPGLYNDLQIFQNDLRFCLIKGEQVEADKGYIGEPLHVSVPSKSDAEEKKKMKTNARMRQENVNRFFKTFEILKQHFRHPREKHCNVFWSIAVLVQIGFDMKEVTNYQVNYVGETYEEARQYLGDQI